jgi:hypothetical protein
LASVGLVVRKTTVDIHLTSVLSLQLCPTIGRRAKYSQETQFKIVEKYLFEENVPNPKGRWRRPQASMRVGGEIQFSTVAYEALGCPDHVVVMFDRASMTIALRPAASKTERNGQKVYKRYTGWLVKSDSLLTQFDLELDSAVRFKDVRVDDRGRLILALGTALPFWNGGRVGAFHNAGKKKLERQLPIRKKIIELVKERFEEAEPNLATPDLKNTLAAIEQHREIEPRVESARKDRRAFEKRLRELTRSRTEWERSQRAKGIDPYPPGTPPPDDRKTLNDARRRAGKPTFE